MDAQAQAPFRRALGRYAIYDEIASGGMASVHIGRLRGPAGFSRTVAIKSMHAQYAKDPEFVAMFLDEARLAARIRHPNVVATLDIVALKGEIFLVMDYVQGESLSRLLHAAREKGAPVPAPIVSSIMVNVLDGLHAAHEATDEQGEPLHIIHRDVSPHNMMVGHDGIARVLDFGVAKAAARAQTTRNGQVKGKFAYMAPEQITRQKIDRRADIFAASIVLWEALVGERLFSADDPAAVVARVMTDRVVAPSTLVQGLSAEIDAVVLKGLTRDREKRFASAAELARALERAVPPARPNDVAQWVNELAGDALSQRARRIAEIESSSVSLPPASAAAISLATQGPSSSEATKTDLSSATPAQPHKRRPTGAWITLGVFAIAGTLAVFGFQRARAHPNAETGVSSVVPPAPTTENSQSSSPLATNAPSQSAAPSPPLTSHVRPRQTTTHTSPTSSAPRNDCDPPYTFDEQGVKSFKRGCL